MDKSQILKEISCLITDGFRKSALDLVQNYLEHTPNDPFLLSLLGRIYLLENKPELAVKYLELSHKISHDEITKSETNKPYEFDNLDSDDLAYIDETENTIENINANIASDIPSIPIHPLKDQITNSFYHPSSIFSQENIPNTESDFSQKTNLTSNYINYADYGVESFTPPSKIKVSAENWQNELFYNDEEINLDEYEHDEFEIDSEDDILIIPEIDDVLIEKEFDWNDLDEFDEIDGQEAFDFDCGNQILTGGKLERQKRAKQIAVEVIQAYDWGKENLPLLEQVFFENGWAMTRVSIERELTKGLMPEELELALFIRQVWTENQQYWISFIHIISNQTGQQTRDAYKNMSWAEALRIIRSFSNIPSEEEIQLLIDQIYDDWYCSEKLQTQFKAFIKYLKYCTGSVRQSLPGTEIFSFVNGYDEALKQERIDIEQILINIEQKHAIIKPEVNFEDLAAYGDR